MTENTKPLSKYYRQPSIYIKFPSGGNLYPPHVVKKTTTGEHAVLPMTAMDDLAFRTPDAMMSGQATIDVIKSCVPDILDPWQLVNYDIDTVLIGIRIASYGESMDVQSTIPGINETVTHAIGLTSLLDNISREVVKDTATLSDGLKIKVRPLNYKQITDSQLKTFEQQRQYAQISQSAELSAEEKTKKYTDSFKLLTQLNEKLLLTNIESITLPTGETVSDPQQIKEFVDNAEAKMIKNIETELIKIRQQGSMKPVQVNATEEQIKKGAPASYQVPITFDNANFFV